MPAAVGSITRDQPGPGVYLDHAASTPLDPVAHAAISKLLDEGVANPSGAHRLARRAREVLDQARDEVARFMGFRPEEVVFTSGGTEADNLAITGTMLARPGRVLVSAVEHVAVLSPAARMGAELIPVDKRGVVDLDALEDLLSTDVTLVSVMLANNEVGVVQPLEEIASIVRERSPRALLHADAVHAAPWIDIASACRCCDLVSLSGHKAGGPKGIGALAIRAPGRVEALSLGGPQEGGIRAGTENVVGAAGMAAALSVVSMRRQDAVRRVGALRDRLLATLVSQVDGLADTLSLGALPAPTKVAGSCHVCIQGVDSEELLFLLDKEGVYASAGSACASGAAEPSHVLAAMKVPGELARGALRLSLGHSTSEEDIEVASDAVARCVDRLRGPASV